MKTLQNELWKLYLIFFVLADCVFYIYHLEFTQIYHLLEVYVITNY